MTAARETPARWRPPAAVACYIVATIAWGVGLAGAAHRYPGSYDWAYTVISALASRKHNPEGAAWFAGAMVVAMSLLWPAVTQLTQARPGAPPPPRWTVIALRIGVIGGALVGTERLLFFHFSNLLRKGHELLALVSFLGCYTGVIGLYLHGMRTRRSSWLPAAVVLVPLVAVGLRELVLYVAQRGVGWADHDWRGAGTPLWFSFALWQWLAAGLLWAALGHLLLTSRPPAGESQLR